MTELLEKIIDCLDLAARAERYIPSVKAPGRPNMYSILDIIHKKNEHGFYEKSKMKIRASGKMLNAWELSIELLLLVSQKDRELLWSRANRFNYSQIGRMLGYDRRKVKNLYFVALFNLEHKLKENKSFLAKLDKI